MPTPLSYYLLRFNFALKRGSTQEDVAVFGLAMHPLGDAEYGDAQLIKAAHGGYNAWNTEMPTKYWGNNVVLASVTATSFQADGKTLFEQNYVDGAPWTGTSSHASMPWETSLACSLYTYTRGTFVAHQRRRRGRFYLPPMTADWLEIANSGYFMDSELPTFHGHVHDFLHAAEEDDLGVRIAALSVYSREDSVLRNVQNTYMDAKFDSQRRRQNREVAGINGIVY